MFEPLRIEVKSLWQEEVGVRDWYITKCRREKRSLQIYHNKCMMTLTPEELINKKRRESELPMKDKYTNKTHYLFYYAWKPTYIQESLL